MHRFSSTLGANTAWPCVCLCCFVGHGPVLHACACHSVQPKHVHHVTHRPPGRKTKLVRINRMCAVGSTGAHACHRRNR